MKSIAAFFLFGIAIELSAQIPVFQVLYAEKASLSNGTPLKSLDKLLDETIHIADSGYLVLIHETGIPVEFSEDTTIVLGQIRAILDPPLTKKAKQRMTKSNSVDLRHSYQRSIGLNFLFITDEAEARNARPGPKACLDCGHPNSGVRFPPLIDYKIFYTNKDAKIMWFPRFGTIRFILKFKNEFDEELMRPVEVMGNHYIFSINQISTQKNLTPTFFVYIEGNQKTREDNLVAIVAPFYSSKIDFPYSGEIATPAAALMAGYFYETTSLDISKDAKPYYELATQLSDKQFYKDMLSNYLKRSGQ